MSCIVCADIQEDLCDVKGHVRDDIIEIFGARTENCIPEEEKICIPCSEMFEKFANLKRRWRYLILRPPELRKPVNIDHIRSMFAHLHLDENAEEQRCIPTPAPSSLYTVSHCTKYWEINKRPKSRKKRGHRWTRKSRSSSRLSGWSSTSGWSRSGISTIYSPTSDFLSDDMSRPNTPYSGFSSISDMSRLSYHTNEEDENKPHTSDVFFHCPHCTIYLADLNKLNYHIRKHHGGKQLFICTECEDTFSTQDHLRHHSKIHDFSPFFCLMCCEPQADRLQLQNHLDLHMMYSVPCNYCDKSFLNEKKLKVHYKSEHSRKKKKAIEYRKNLILSKKVYNKRFPRPVGHPVTAVERPKTPAPSQDHPILIHPRLKRYLDKNFYICIAPQNPGGLEITIENLALENVPLYKGEGYGTLDCGTDMEADNREKDDSNKAGPENNSEINQNHVNHVAEEMDPTDNSCHSDTQDSIGGLDNRQEVNSSELGRILGNDENQRVQENVRE